MRHANLSGSGGDRARACPPAYALPATFTPSGPAALRGTHGHRYLEMLQTMVPELAITLVPEEYRAMCAEIPFAEVPRGEPEVAYAYDVERDTARRLPGVRERGYPKLAATEIPLTLDLVFDRIDKETGECRRAVLDWKFARIDNTPLAVDAMQLWLAALAVTRDEGLSEIDAAIVRVDGAEMHWDWAAFDSMALDAFAAEWSAAHSAVRDARADYARGKELTVNPGDHCKWCPAKAACPAFAAAAREIVVDRPGDWVARFEAEIVQDDGAATWWTKLARAEEIVATMRGIIETRAAARPFALPDGSMVMETVTKRESVRDGEAAYKALAEIGGDDLATHACAREWSTSKGAIEKAAKTNGVDPKMVLAVLRERGVIRTNESRKVDVIPAARLAKGA